MAGYEIEPPSKQQEPPVTAQETTGRREGGIQGPEALFLEVTLAQQS